MRTARTHPRKALVMAASTRTGSVNQALAQQIAARIEIEAPVEIVDLRHYSLPLYDGDLEARDGVPAAAAALAGEMASADVLVIVSPEYNGTFTPLLKNTVDWVTRIDASAFAHLRVLVDIDHAELTRFVSQATVERAAA